MRLVKSSEVGLRIAQALGLGDLAIRGITISMPANEVVTVTVEIYPNPVEFGVIETLLKEFDLIERELLDMRHLSHGERIRV